MLLLLSLCPTFQNCMQRKLHVFILIPLFILCIVELYIACHHFRLGLGTIPMLALYNIK